MQAVGIFAEFGVPSGAILNRNRTTAVMIGNINLTAQTEWLNIENYVNILGVLFSENMNQARKMNWQKVLNGLKTRLWFHNPRKLSLIQKVTLLNAYISSKIWYMASNLLISKGFISKIKTEYGKFLCHGQPLQRVAYSNLILPKNRGGLNLHCPGTKAYALLINRLMSLVDRLPFPSSFVENPDLVVPSMCSHISFLKNEVSRLPVSETIHHLKLFTSTQFRFCLILDFLRRMLEIGKQCSNIYTPNICLPIKDPTGIL